MNTDNPITDYWYKYFCTQHCTLCGNSGRINTTGVKTAAGVEVGRINFCICPNGQIMRDHDERPPPGSIGSRIEVAP